MDPDSIPPGTCTPQMANTTQFVMQKGGRP